MREEFKRVSRYLDTAESDLDEYSLELTKSDRQEILDSAKSDIMDAIDVLYEMEKSINAMYKHSETIE